MAAPSWKSEQQVSASPGCAHGFRAHEHRTHGASGDSRNAQNACHACDTQKSSSFRRFPASHRSNTRAKRAGPQWQALPGLGFRVADFCPVVVGLTCESVCYRGIAQEGQETDSYPVYAQHLMRCDRHGGILASPLMPVPAQSSTRNPKP